MHSYQPKRSFSEQTSLSKIPRLGQLQEEIEFMRELIDSLKLELNYKTQQLQETVEELRDTNYELGNALIPSDRLTLNEAKQLAQQLLTNNKPAKECLAELLSEIYDSPVDLGDIEPKPMQPPTKLSPSKPTDLDRFFPQINRFSNECEKLCTQSIGHQDLVARLPNQSAQLKDNLQKVQKRRQD